jgi:hypothetical protein
MDKVRALLREEFGAVPDLRSLYLRHQSERIDVYARPHAAITPQLEELAFEAFRDAADRLIWDESAPTIVWCGLVLFLDAEELVL